MPVIVPSLAEQNARAFASYHQVETHILETEIKPRITPEIIEEHRRKPLGKHSDQLERVLVYLRKRNLELAGKYILVCTRPHEQWRVATISGRPGVPPTLLDEVYGDRYEAEHGIFLRRLTDNGLLPR
jgi:hypothetical protein